MRERFMQWRQSLSVQVVILLGGLILVTALAVGLPALWVIRDQLERQSWALVEQGSQTSQAILAKRRSDLQNLAILTAQRPTLQRLVEHDDRQELPPYLLTLQQGAGVDLLLLCDAQGKELLQVGAALGDNACASSAGGYWVEQTDAVSRGWLLATYLLPDEKVTVVLGVILNDRFALQLKEESGLEQVLLLRGVYAASSFSDGARLWQAAEPVMNPGGDRFSLSDQSGSVYYLMRSIEAGDGVEWVVALPVSHLLAVWQQLSRMMGFGIAAVILLGIALGILRTRRITRPLEKLRDAAEALRQGQLSRPVPVDSSIREVALLSFALEDARIALNHTLTELRQERDWSEHVLESVVEGIVTVDKRMRITFFSHGAEQITGWEERSVIGRSVDEIFLLDDGEARFSQCLPPPGSRQKIRVRMKDGQSATLAVTGAQLLPPEAGRSELALVLRDVSNEEAIRRLLGDFLANITHEFRTPLSALAASIELLLDQLPDLTPDELRELLNNIHVGTVSLQNLIDNLLEGASIETGRFRVWMHPCQAQEIVQEAVHAVAPLADKYGLSIRTCWTEALPLIQADFRRTTQVLVNLLSNAVKWSPSGSEIVVSIESAPDSLILRVADSGPGISLDDLPDLFHRFHPRSSAGGEQGTGLGLSVVKAIVEAQGGQVGASNRPDGGAVFWFTLCPVGPDLEEEQ
jgi:PAS domain S-box-containing protein